MDTQRTMRQIDKIKQKLGSREHFLLWLRNAPPFDSANDCTAWIVVQVVEGSDQISQLAGEVASAVRIPLVGQQTWRYADAAVARAQREVFLLYFLYVRINMHVVAEASVYTERCPSLISALSRTLEQGELLLKLRKDLLLVNPDQAPPGGPAGEAEIRRCIVLWGAQLGDLRKEGESLKRRIIETQLVVELIDRLYFAERVVLWRSASAFLDTAQSDEFKALQDRLRAADERVKAAGLEFSDMLNVHDTRPAIESQAKKTAERLVVMAKVDTLRHMGERETARELLMGRIKKEENCEAEAEALLGLESPGGPRT